MCPPDAPQCDSIGDYLLDEFAQVAHKLPAEQRAGFLEIAKVCIAKGLAAAGDIGVDDSTSERGRERFIALLQLMTHDDNSRVALWATCYLRLLNVEGRSLDQIGRDFGIVRATVDLVYRRLQKWLEKRGVVLKGRGDKSPAAREDCRRRRLGQRKPRTAWQHAHLWKTPTPLLQLSHR